MPDLLIELFSEEIPARMQARARDDLRRMVTDGLVTAGLTYAHAAALSTPRRLTLAVEGLTAQSAAVREERKGPATTAPQQAIDGFLRSTGLTLDQLETRPDKKGEAYFAVIERPGRAAPEIIAEVLEATIRTFPWPKSMRWGSGSLKWVRPLHSILCILTDEAGAEVVPLTLDGITASNTTHGHRFLSPAPFAVSSFDDYSAKLKRAHVILDSAEREAAIWHDATTATFAAGLEVVPDPALLTEVAGLVEWPVVLMGRIDAAFLDLPPEVLQTSMREHQKFFSVKNPKTGRIEGFITVANTETADNGATILHGNQKVLRARLSDAKFFWENDLRVARAGMKDWSQGLASVTFHNKLGSQADRIARIATLAVELAPFVGADSRTVDRAAWLAKLDLRSAMVGEFPELQGVMGRYYALAGDEEAAVADAIRDHWRPRGEGDEVPTAPVSVAVALADRIDTLAGFWSINEKPTGSKDPFALRRAALGVIRLVLTNGLRIGLTGLLAAALAADELERALFIGVEPPKAAPDPKLLALLDDETAREVMEVGPILNALAKEPSPDQSNAVAVGTELLAFLHDRLKVHLRDGGIRHDVIDACLAMPGNDDLTLLVKRAQALQATLATDDGANLIAGFKRANNILSQAEEKDGVEYSYGADPKFAETDEERALFTALDTAEGTIKPAMATEDFTTAMQAMATLRAPIDTFFTATQINTENQIVRRNRLNLLSRIRTICLSVADLTKLDG